MFLAILSAWGRHLALAGVLCAAISMPIQTIASAGEYKVNKGYFGSVAIMGYDPVAYFTVGKAVKGSEEFSYDWLGATWHFASAEHRDMFAGNPNAYAPQYGGYCSDGFAYETNTPNIDPQAFRIIAGKLYLNHDQISADELTDIPGQLQKAEAGWRKLRANLPD